ncbi:polysaccharide biosynthesis tyrosine autokinase [Oscillatoria sp. FACHB-1407]|uniref:GumC family protein n=1 Tax=Oscillatoria sp. FACHB-1407 TaxID=2692847 RepID=UPI001684A434|nr:tyrosine-protein kinase domain-containing protein [Oscillatoria sp. FACHB-1407]MBD2462394.1 polysaccharide biosynthesis tyrosine autokinase [Oscillatoria sp. FACHB-1407]
MAPPFIKRYLIALDRHKWAGLAGFAVVMGLSGVAALQPAPPATYTAQGSLSYATPPVTFSETGVALQQQGQALTPERLLSNYVIDSTVQKLTAQGIQVDPRTIRQNTTVEAGDDDDEAAGLNLLITYIDADEERAEVTATLLMEAMVEQSREFNKQQLETIINSLNDLLPEVTRELREAERNLEQYIRVEGPAIQAAQDGNLVGAITGGQDQQRQLRLTLAGIDAQIRSLQSRLGLSPDEAYASAALSADPIIADLRAQMHQTETQLSILSRTLQPAHPTMVTLRNQQQAFERLLQQRVSEVIGGASGAAPLRGTAQIRQDSSLDPARQQLANTLVNLQTQRETIQQQLVNLNQEGQRLRQEYSNLPNKQLEQARLEQQVALKRAYYDQIQQRLADVTIAQNEVVGNLIVTQDAQAQLTEASGANPVLILIVGGFVGLLVGGGLVLLLDSLDATFHTLPDLQAALRQQEVPVLGLLPALPANSETDSPIVLEPDSLYIEPYERLRGTLRRAAGSKSLKMMLLTSTVNGEGKTLTAYNLAIASARAGKRTLLIEADLRSPSHSKLLKVTPDPDSVLEPLRYYGRLSDCIRLVPEIENLYILPSPGIQRQASAILESTEMRQMLEDARGRFDLVILDTPALSRFSDALLLEPYTDGMVLVTRPGYTEEGLLTEAIEQFNESEEMQFLGAVINGADIAIQSPGFIGGRDDQFIVEELENQPGLDGIPIGSREP